MNKKITWKHMAFLKTYFTILKKANIFYHIMKSDMLLDLKWIIAVKMDICIIMHSKHSKMRSSEKNNHMDFLHVIDKLKSSPYAKKQRKLVLPFCSCIRN